MTQYSMMKGLGFINMIDNSVQWGNDCLTLVFGSDSDNVFTVQQVRADRSTVAFTRHLPLVEMMAAGTGHWIANDRLIHTSLGRELCYVSHQTSFDKATGLHHLDVVLHHVKRRLSVIVHYTLPDGIPMLRSSVTVVNKSDKALNLESVTSLVSSFGAPVGQTASLDGWTLTEGNYDWLGEGRWATKPVRDLLPALGQRLTGVDPRSAYQVISSGTWSTGKHATLAILENRSYGLAWLFQIEHNGPWRWEIGDNTTDGYFALSGPTSVNHSWSKRLGPGEEFTTVPASVALTGDFQSAVGAVTAYRRAMRVRHEDNGKVRVVFNDYMNTINGDPTTAKLLPLIDGASKVGIEVFVIDCGWYDDSGDWWSSVGEWMPSKTRFPGAKGIVEVIDAIRDKGMVPGIWLEPEVIGVKSPMAHKLPDSAFFHRNGQRVVEQERYILDLRDHAARRHLDSVIDRLVNDYGIGYIKMDYNVSPGSGTDYQGEAPGEGLLGHNRAYLQWVEGIHRRFPHVILENCSSGGMREDFAQTSRFEVQSTSDQQDYRLYPAIAASAPLMMLPEQAANWAYPQPDMTPEQTAFNINTTFLGRFFLSGYINRMSDEQLAIVKHAIEAYKTHVQPVIGSSTPFWPLGLPSWNDKVLALGLRGEGLTLVTVFPAQPGFDDWPISWNTQSGEATVTIPAKGGYLSRTFEFRA